MIKLLFSFDKLNISKIHHLFELILKMLFFKTVVLSRATVFYQNFLRIIFQFCKFCIIYLQEFQTCAESYSGRNRCFYQPIPPFTH